VASRTQLKNIWNTIPIKKLLISLKIYISRRDDSCEKILHHAYRKKKYILKIFEIDRLSVANIFYTCIKSIIIIIKYCNTRILKR